MESLEEATKYSLTRKASARLRSYGDCRTALQGQSAQSMAERENPTRISRVAAIHGLPSLAGNLRSHFLGRCLNTSEWAVSMVTSIP